jgi:hypothetical protein
MRHFLNDIEISPRNRDSIGVVSDFTGNPEVLSLNIDTLQLPREAYQIVKDHIATIGVFEGIPYRVEMATNISLDYYVDLTDPANSFRLYDCEVKIKRRMALDSFMDNANGTTFELMLKKGVDFDRFLVPYIIVKDNQAELAITLGISLYVMTKELIQAVKDLATMIADGVQGSTPNPGVPPSFPLGALIAYILKIAAQVIYIAALTIALVDLTTQLFALIFPPVRNLRAAKIQELMKKGCEYLGYTFESTLFDQYPNYTILPVPLIPNRKSYFDFLPEELTQPFNKGVPSASDTVSTLGTLFTTCEQMFNARTIVYNGQVRFERRDYGQNQVNLQLQPALTIQPDRDDQFSYNVDDIWKRYYIHYSLDQSDSHTLDEIYDFAQAEYSTEPTNVVNYDLVSIKGLNEVDIPFALGQRKAKLNWLEKLAKTFFELADEATALFGGGTNFAAKIDGRVGVLVISQNVFTVTKLLYTSAGRQQQNFTNYVSAGSLWNKFHYIEQIALNDYIIKTDARVRIKASDFVTLLDNNYVEIDGVSCEILRLEWVDEKTQAVITYKEPNNYADGRVYTLTIND